jgi:hypothetical protein
MIFNQMTIIVSQQDAYHHTHSGQAQYLSLRFGYSAWFQSLRSFHSHLPRAARLIAYSRRCALVSTHQTCSSQRTRSGHAAFTYKE